jgi:hypothetical protein
MNKLAGKLWVRFYRQTLAAAGSRLLPFSAELAGRKRSAHKGLFLVCAVCLGLIEGCVSTQSSIFDMAVSQVNTPLLVSQKKNLGPTDIAAEEKGSKSIRYGYGSTMTRSRSSLSVEVTALQLDVTKREFGVITGCDLDVYYAWYSTGSESIECRLGVMEAR